MTRDAAYWEAGQRIESARKEGATELDLSGMKLTELPEAIASLTQLQSLDLSRNQLTQLPEAIAFLAQLRSLNLSENKLTNLPEAICSLTQLQSLDLFDNQLTELPDGLEQLSKLEKLWIGFNPLTELPISLLKLPKLKDLRLIKNEFKTIPEWIGRLKSLKRLDINANQLTELPETLSELSQLEELWLGGGAGGNPLQVFPACIRQLKQLRDLQANDCEFKVLPNWLYELIELQNLNLEGNHLIDLPASIGHLSHLQRLQLDNNPLNSDLIAAYEQGTKAVMQYLRARAEGEVTLNEAKLILVGEGEVGKSCLLGALRGDAWVDGRPTTHGIEIKPVIVTAPDHGTEITLNGWDFGGQRVYRPTHQLFFSSSAVYLVVWKPREGPQQGFVKEWITLIKHREPDAKVLVVATHGGPGQRQPDIDRQELIDLFGNDTIVDFFHLDSQLGTGITELRAAIAKIAAILPGMGRSVPTKWQRIRELLEESGKTHLPYKDVIALCEEQGLEGFAAELFVRVSHTLGYLIHYHYDPILQDIVILKPDWLAKAISFVRTYARNI